MEFTLSGNALKTLARSITCLSRVGIDLAIQASPSQLSFHALNSSRSAYQLITLKPDLFDVFTISGAQVQLSILLKSFQSSEHLLQTLVIKVCNYQTCIKVQWTLLLFNGIKKTYRIACNVEPQRTTTICG